MTSREIVQKTLKFDSPERVPRHLWHLPWARFNHPKELDEILNRFPDDIITAPNFYTAVPESWCHFYDPDGGSHQAGEATDEWGCTFINFQKGIIGEVKNPPVKEWPDINKVTIPYDYLKIDEKKVNEFCKNTDKFVLAGLHGGNQPRPFEKMQFIRGSENLYIDMFEKPKELFDFIEKLHDFYKKMFEMWAKTDVDALSFMDDWGSQRSLLISPKTWVEIFKPLYRDYADIAHKYGKSIFMHSDGYILDIYPHLIDIGIDAINSQLFCMGVQNVAKYKGKISFWGEIDRQHLLPHGSLNDIENAVKSVKESLYHNGGVFAQCEFGPGAKPENVYKVFETWEKIV
jgi:uroporphyrinogen decarboxylase